MIWRQPCPSIATIHDLAPFHLPEKYDWRRMLYAQVCARRLARRQRSIIAISQTTAGDIHRFFGIPLERITVIYNGIDHERFRPADVGGATIAGASVAARRFVEERYSLKRPYFIYVSRLEHPAKNHIRLITAFNAFKAATGSPWQLVFAGGDWHGAEAIHAAAQQSPFASEIHILGFVPGDDLPLLYRAAGASVYPSLYEGFGLPPVEAMACGCPVVSSNRGSLGEVVGDAAMQVDPTNIGDWKNALGEISSNESLRARLRNAGLNHARQFDWQRNANATLVVYERALGRVSLQTSEASVEPKRPLLRTVSLR
jgi:glycosyltransferase involved in cell wall biosynthesis